MVLEGGPTAVPQRHLGILELGPLGCRMEADLGLGQGGGGLGARGGGEDLRTRTFRTELLQQFGLKNF